MVIGISGKIGSGKDTVGKIIQYLVYNKEVRTPLNVVLALGKIQDKEAQEALTSHSGWEIRKFADKLKEICSLLTGIPRVDFEKQEVKDSFLNEEWQIKHSNWIAEEEMINMTKIDGKKTKEEIQEYINKYFEFQANDGKRNIYRWKFMDSKRTVRWFLQTIGTEAMREKVHNNVWVNALFVDYKAKQGIGLENHTWDDPKLPNWLITDMRFPNELEAVEKYEGLTIRINRKLSLRFPKQWDDYKESAHYELTEENFLQWVKDRNIKLYNSITHPSETSLDNAQFNAIIDNNGTIEELVEKVRIVLGNARII